MSETIAFKPETLEQVNKIIARYPEGRQKSALIPILHVAQKEFGGWLDVPVMDYVAQILNIKPIEVYEVATFYTMFNMKPVGKYVLEVCRTGPWKFSSPGTADFVGVLRMSKSVAGEIYQRSAPVLLRPHRPNQNVALVIYSSFLTLNWTISL